MYALTDGRLSVWQMLHAQGRILVAVMLRDVRTRFFGSAFGFLVVIAWPLSHIFILLTINTLAGRAVPYGDSAALWFATGIVPFMAFSYTARFTMMGIVQNRPLLALPVVKISDLLFARAILEVLNAGVVIIATMIIFALLDIAFAPIDVVQAFFAIAACMLLGFGFGIVNGVVAGMLPFWVTGYALFNIVMWLASGVLFVPDAFPEGVRYILSFNPALDGVEWMRSAYYEGYGSGLLDKSYMISFSLVVLFLGLALERLMRGKIL